MHPDHSLGVHQASQIKSMCFEGDSGRSSLHPLNPRLPSAFALGARTTHPYLRCKYGLIQYTTFSVLLDKQPVLTFDKGCKRV